MGDMDYREAAYLVNDMSILHLQESGDGCHYAAFDIVSNEKTDGGTIPWDSIRDTAGYGSLAAFRAKAFQEMDMDGGKVAVVSINMLEKCRESGIRRRKILEPETLPQKDIRFIDSRYNELFRIPDGGYIRVEYPDRQFSVKCRHIDEYHTYIGTEVFHICQFAELLKRNGGRCQPEPESNAVEMGWRLGYSRYLTLQNCEDGWKFHVYDDKFRELADGLLDKPGLSINEARNAIMTDQEMESRTMTKLGYGFIKERAEAARPEQRESLLGKLETMKASAPAQDAPAPKKQRGTER